MSDADLSSRIAFAEQAKAALDRFLDPAFAAVVSAYRERLEDVAAAKPGDTGPIINLAMAIKIAAEVRKQITAIVDDGKMARAKQEQVRVIERMSPEARKFV